MRTARAYLATAFGLLAAAVSAAARVRVQRQPDPADLKRLGIDTGTPLRLG